MTDEAMEAFRKLADLRAARLAFLRDGLQYARGQTRKMILKQIAEIEAEKP